MGIKTLRPDLTEYRVALEVLMGKVNEQAFFPLSLTDIVKMCIEKVMKEQFPSVKFQVKRKKFIRMDY